MTTQLDKIEEALAATEKMLALERKKLDILHQLKEGLRAHKVCPEIDLDKPVQIRRVDMGLDTTFSVKNGDAEKWITRKQYDYIKGFRDDY